jgi:hypothetical protein
MNGDVNCCIINEFCPPRSSLTTQLSQCILASSCKEMHQLLLYKPPGYETDFQYTSLSREENNQQIPLFLTGIGEVLWSWNFLQVLMFPSNVTVHLLFRDSHTSTSLCRWITAGEYDVFLESGNESRCSKTREYKSTVVRTSEYTTMNERIMISYSWYMEHKKSIKHKTAFHSTFTHTKQCAFHAYDMKRL